MIIFFFHEVTGVKVVSNVKKSNVNSLWSMMMACLMKKRLENSNCGSSLDSGIQESSSVHSGCPANPQCHVFSFQNLLAITAEMSITFNKSWKTHWCAAHSLPETTVLLWVSWEVEQNVVFVALYFYPAIKRTKCKHKWTGWGANKHLV